MSAGPLFRFVVRWLKLAIGGIAVGLAAVAFNKLVLNNNHNNVHN